MPSLPPRAPSIKWSKSRRQNRHAAAANTVRCMPCADTRLKLRTETVTGRTVTVPRLRFQGRADLTPKLHPEKQEKTVGRQNEVLFYPSAPFVREGIFINATVHITVKTQGSDCRPSFTINTRSNKTPKHGGAGGGGTTWRNIERAPSRNSRRT